MSLETEILEALKKLNIRFCAKIDEGGDYTEGDLELVGEVGMVLAKARAEPPIKSQMKPIPISAAERIAKDYGYDQVIIIARKVGDAPDPYGEHCTTYGINKAHCEVAARAGDFLKYKVMGWAAGGEQ